VGLNSQYFLKNGGNFVISIKASCIDSTAPPEAVFAREVKKLQEQQLKPKEQVRWQPCICASTPHTTAATRLICCTTMPAAACCRAVGEGLSDDLTPFRELALCATGRTQRGLLRMTLLP
jgi:hypothetical protein